MGDLADRLESLPDLSRAVQAQITGLERLAGRTDDLADIDRVGSNVDRLIASLDRQLARAA